MTLARRWLVAIAWLGIGCGGDGAAGTGAPKPEPKTQPEPETKTPTEPETKTPPGPETKVPSEAEPKAPPEPYVVTQPLPEIVVTNPEAACPELPTLAADASEARKALVPYAAALRRLACEPALFGKTTAELRTTLGLPEAAGVDFRGPRGVRLTLPGEPTAGDVAAVFGIDAPQINLTWQAYHAITTLGTNARTGAFDLWSPGRVTMGIVHEVNRYGDDAGKEEILPAASEERVSTSVTVGMPEDVVTIVADRDAVPLVVSAIEQLAARPELLAKPPGEVGTAIGFEGERFALAETSLHAGETVIRGISIAPRRTIIPAAALAEALGLTDAEASCVNREHDVWHMKAGGTTEIAWKGLVLEINVASPKGDANEQPLGTLEATFVIVRPKAP